jgi:hypothetical protein
MKARLCTHVKITGHRCGSPALRGQPHCYFHHQILSSRQPQADDSQLHSIALIENEEAVQVALMQVIDALLKNTMDTRRAGLVIKALYIASVNARRARFDNRPEEMIITTPSCGARALARENNGSLNSGHAGPPALRRPAEESAAEECAAEQSSAAPQDASLLTARESEELEGQQSLDRLLAAVRDRNLSELDAALASMDRAVP